MTKSYLIVITLILLFAFVIFSYKTAPSKPLPSVPTQSEELDADKLWNLVNEYRLGKNLSPFIKSQPLCNIAKDRAAYLTDKYYSEYNHDKFLETVNRYLSPDIEVSENITGGTSEQDALDNWLNSPSHKQAIEASWKYSCIACSSRNCAQIFSNF